MYCRSAEHLEFAKNHSSFCSLKVTNFRIYNFHMFKLAILLAFAYIFSYRFLLSGPFTLTWPKVRPSIKIRCRFELSTTRARMVDMLSIVKYILKRFYDDKGGIGAFHSVSASIGLSVSSGFPEIHLCVPHSRAYWHDIFALYVDSQRRKLTWHCHFHTFKYWISYPFPTFYPGKHGWNHFE